MVVEKKIIKMLVQNSLHLILNIVGIVFYIHRALATSCQPMYPSEYAYHDDSVTRTESASANCRSYSSGPFYPKKHIHCDGTQLKLADSNIVQEQYQPTDYYVWSSRTGEQLLFIFSTRVSLTTITLHYYSDSVRGQSRLRFYAAPDDFEVWDAPATRYPHAEVAKAQPGGGQAGHRSIRINVNFNTMKVVMYVYGNSFQFAVSEVEFLKCTQATTNETITSTTAMSSNSISIVQTISDNETIILDSTETYNDLNMQRGQSVTEVIAIGVSTVLILLILSSALIIAVAVLFRNYRRSAKQELNTDALYSTLNRGSEQQAQLQYMEQNSNDLYDQIHLSPSTGQTEYIPKPQSENISNPFYNSHPTNPDMENSVTSASIESQVNSPLATYAAVDSSKRKKMKKDDIKHTAAEKYTQNVSPSKGVHTEWKGNSTKCSQKSLHDVCAPDYQDREKVNSEQESDPPPSVEELYTAVKKKPKVSSVPVNELEAEDLYTAVMKKPKKSSVTDEVVPSVPPHTIEELYTAVNKEPKSNTTEDEEEAPPIPPHTVDDSF